MLAEITIQRAQTEWASSIIQAPKKDGKLRFRVDYCKLKAVTKQYLNAIIRVNDCIASLADATKKSTPDADSEY